MAIVRLDAKQNERKEKLTSPKATTPKAPPPNSDSGLRRALDEVEVKHYFPPGPEFKLIKEAAAQKAGNMTANSSRPAPGEKIPISPYFAKKEEDAFWGKHYHRLLMRDPIKPGNKDADLEAPSEDETMRALQKARPAEDSAKCTVERNRVRIVSELIQDSIDPPREMPLVGPVQVHHVHFKCTVYFQETVHKLGRMRVARN